MSEVKRDEKDKKEDFWLWVDRGVFDDAEFMALWREVHDGVREAKAA